MSEEEYRSNIIINLQREIDPGSGRFSNREMRTYFQPEESDTVQYNAGLTQYFDRIGTKVAFVTKYQEGMLKQLGVNAVIETPDVLLKEPLVIEEGPNLGFTMHFDDEDKSLESISIVSGGEFSGALQTGFLPQEQTSYNLGKTLDKKQVRLVFQDIRPKPAIGMTPSSMK